ncbi:MAG: cation transporter [Oscillospiraceae bacterium]|nr:cation transporter [Oscillospiraceae bacterium]
MTNLLPRLFIRGYEQYEDAAVRARYGKLAGAVGIVCNVLLCAVKLAIGLVSGSVAILADGVNNLSDASASVVTLLGFKIAEKPADADHPYGHARMEYLSGLAVAALILVIGVDLVKSSVSKIFHPQEVAFSLPLAVVLGLSIGVKLWMAHFNRTLGRRIGSETLIAAAADSRNDVISTAAVLAAWVVGYGTGVKIDGYAGLAVALFILYSGVTIARDTIDPLLGKAPSPELVRSITEGVLAYDKVLGIHDLMIHDYGPGRRFASVHVEMDSQEDPLACHDIIDDIERDFLTRRHIRLVIHYDPVVTDDAELNQMRGVVTETVQAIDSRFTLHDFRMVRGPGHTNLIFDLVIPYERKDEKRALSKLINERIQQVDRQYYAVITFDDSTFNA